MRTTTKRLLPLFAATALFGTFGAAPALADGTNPAQTTTLETTFTAMNDSGTEGAALLTLEGNQLNVNVETSGMLPAQPHLQHIHFGGANECPEPSAQGSGVDGAFRDTDGFDFYGQPTVSLTTAGDTSVDSALAQDRFPVGNADYERTIEVSDDVAESLRNGDGSILVHGVDHNGTGVYDGAQGSDHDPSIPSEVTDLAACGALSVSQVEQMPEGGVETGDGTTSGVEDAGLMVAGGGLLVAAAAGAVALRSRKTTSA